LRAREATEPLPPPATPYRVCDPFIAEIHRTRAAFYREKEAGLILKDERPKH
jgi:hypothetical protein